MRQVSRSYALSGSSQGDLNYLLYLPREYGQDPNKKWPLILFLHGAGERGDDLQLLLKHGIPKLVETRDDFPFVTLSPQCPEGSFWYLLLSVLDGLLTHVASDLALDPDRAYLTGLSMGGYGVWHLAARYPNRFAAIAPICGGGLESLGFPDKVRALKDVPVWAFHGAHDTVVPLAESRRLVDALRACGGSADLTAYPDTPHDAWTRTYEDPALFEWFLRHRRSPK
jgi:predicted peptidase